MHCNLRPSDVAPLIPGFNHETCRPVCNSLHILQFCSIRGFNGNWIE